MKRWLLSRENVVKEVIEAWIEVKRGKPCIMLLNDTKASETYDKIKHKVLDSLEPTLGQNTNDDETIT